MVRKLVIIIKKKVVATRKKKQKKTTLILFFFHYFFPILYINFYFNLQTFHINVHQQLDVLFLLLNMYFSFSGLLENVWYKNNPLNRC